jgi:phosphoesterase RecJ-like protein
MKSIEEALPLLAQPKKIFITTHHKPDGDAVGSVLGLYHYLVKKGHTVYPVVPSEAPDFLMWLPGVEHLMNFEAESKKCIEAIKQADIIFGLDFNAFERVKHMQPYLEASTATKILIDHHMFPAPVWDYGVSIPAKSSTCEMVYDFINLCGDNALIDLDIAKALYTGVLTDTGSFRFPVTTSGVHTMVADLLNRGLKHSEIHEEVYDSWSVNRMRFVGYMLIERMEIFPKWNAGLVTISKKDLQLFSLSMGDTEGLVNYPLNIAGIKFATLITERADEVKLSFRSKGDFDVNSFAREYFNGGGHFNASGGRSTESFSDTITRFKQILSDIHPR